MNSRKKAAFLLSPRQKSLNFLMFPFTTRHGNNNGNGFNGQESETTSDACHEYTIVQINSLLFSPCIIRVKCWR